MRGNNARGVVEDGRLRNRLPLDVLPPELAQHQAVKLLGEGGEGAVYLLHDGQTEEQKVLKLFHRPRPKSLAEGLLVYAAGVGTDDCAGLFPARLVQNADHVLGVIYPYRRLYSLNRRLRQQVDQIGQALIGAYCQMQWYLMEQHAIGLWDVGVGNFMLDRHGQFWFVDFGYGISPLDNMQCADQGKFEYGFVMLVLSIYGINLKLIRREITGYSYADPCIYCTELNDLAIEHDWIDSIVGEVRGRAASLFLDPQFYARICADLPGQVPWPRAMIAASRCATGLARFRMALRGNIT